MGKYTVVKNDSYRRIVKNIIEKELIDSKFDCNVKVVGHILEVAEPKREIVKGGEM